jgi:hypothetical protein
MKFNSILFVLLGLVGISVLINACGSSPTAPAATPTPVPPTATYTVCTDGSGHTCTPTDTLTATNTATETFTSTPTATATNTYSPTLTFTHTVTSTPTQTYTPTSTGTPTNTATITDTPTITYTWTITNTPLPYTATPSYTPTNTYTSTLCPTQVFTATAVADGYSISGTVDYTPGGVSATHPIYVVAFQPSNGGSPAAYAIVTTNNTTYTLQGLGNGQSYTVVAFYNASMTGFRWSPPPGSYAALYGTATCLPSNATQITTTGNMTGNNITFGTSNVLNGWAGTASYTGAKGNVDGCKGIFVISYPAGTGISGIRGSASSNNEAYVNTNGGSYCMIGGNGGSSVCVTNSADILVYYDATGAGNSGPQSGDPYYFVSSQSSSTTPNQNYSFGDTNTW